MRQLIFYEVQKIFQRKLMLGVLALLLGINCTLLVYSVLKTNEHGYNLYTVSQVYSDHSDETPEIFLAYLDDWIERYKQILYAHAGDLNSFTWEELKELGPIYGQGLSAQVLLFDDIRNRLTQNIQYAAYLESIETEAAHMTGSLLFSQSSSFSYENAKLISTAYNRVKGVTVSCDDPSGVDLVIDSSVTTLCLLLSVVLVVLNLFLPEYENGMLFLLRTRRHGHHATLWAKATACTVVIFLLVILFYGTNLLLSHALLGLGDLSRPLQSLTSYFSSPLPTSVRRYLFLHVFSVFGGLLAFGLLFSVLCMYFQSLLPTSFAIAGLLLAELALYQQIDQHSVWSPLRELNLAALLNVQHYFGNFNTMNLFGRPISVLWCAPVITVLLITAYVLLAPRAWNRNRANARYNPLRHKSAAFGTFHRCPGLLAQEGYKLFWHNRALLLLVALLIVQIATYSGSKKGVDVDEIYYQRYSSVLAGELTKEKQTYLEEELARYNDVDDQIQSWYQKANTGEVSRAYAQYRVSLLEDEAIGKTGFLRAYEQYIELSGRCEGELRYIADTGYQSLFSSETEDITDTGKLLLVLILGLASFASMEHTSSVDVLIVSSLRGAVSVRRRKIICSLFYTVLAFAVAFLPRIVSVLLTGGLSDFFAPVASLSVFRKVPVWISIFGWVAGTLVLRLLAAMLVSLVVLWLSQKTAHGLATILITFVVFLFPVFTALLGLTGQWGLLPFLTGNVYLHG